MVHGAVTVVILGSNTTAGCSFSACLLSRDMQVRLTDDSKLPVDMNVSMNGCLSLCVSPVVDC